MGSGCMPSGLEWLGVGFEEASEGREKIEQSVDTDEKEK